MTLEEIATDVWEVLGEPTDLSFFDEDGSFDATSKGWTRLMRAARTAQVTISKWRNPRTGKRFRWYGMSQLLTVNVDPGVTGAVTGVANEGRELTVDTTLAVNSHSMWYLVITHADSTVTNARVISSGEGFLSLFQETPTEIGDTYRIVPPFIELTETSLSVLRVTYLNELRELSIVRPEFLPISSEASFGAPSSYYQLHDRIYLDRMPETGVFQVETDRVPRFDPTRDAVPELPENFHQAIVLWMAAWGFARYLNPEMKTSMRKEFYEYMDSIQLPKDLELDRQEDAFQIKKE